jgi:hypothetical protein
MPLVSHSGPEHFDGQEGTDVLAIGGRTEALDVWLLSGQAEAWLSRASHLGELWTRIWRRPPPEGSAAAWAACALWARGDADGDGLDEVVAVSPTAGCDDDQVPRATVVLNPTTLPGEPPVPVSLPRLPAPAAAIRVVDLDRDGCDDFMAVGPEGVLVHWCGEAQDQVTTTGPPDATAVAALQADGDAALELAVLAAAGLWLVDVGAARDPRALVVAAEPAIAAAGDRLEAADASGDGLSDLWVGGAGGVELLQAVSSLDGAQP